MPGTNALECQMVKSARRQQTDLPLNEEQELIVQAGNGSPAAIELLVSRYESRIFRLARNITGNHEDAEEVIQNAFVKAFRNLANFRGDSRFYTWLVRIAVNEALMKIRGRRFREMRLGGAKDSNSGVIPSELEDWGPNPEQRYSQEELRRILERAISKLDTIYRIVFQLRDVEGFSTEETARTLNLSLPTVKNSIAAGAIAVAQLLGRLLSSAEQDDVLRKKRRFVQQAILSMAAARGGRTAAR